jgi:superfamily I DNA/RNA helicase
MITDIPTLNTLAVRPATAGTATSRDVDGPLLLTGPSGSGKTRYLEQRVLSLLSREVPPDAILLLSATCRPPDEVRARLAQKDSRAAALRPRTISSLMIETLRVYAGRAKIPLEFSVLADVEALDLVAHCAERTRAAPRGHGRNHAGSLLSLFSLMARRPLVPYHQHVTAEAYASYRDSERGVLKVRQAYEKAKTDARCLDRVDVMTHGLKLLCDASVRAALGVQHIIVDQLQAANVPALDAIELLARPHGRVIAAADDHQKLESYAMPTEGALREFRRRFPGARLFASTRSSSTSIFHSFLQPLRQTMEGGSASRSDVATPAAYPVAAAPPIARKAVLCVWSDERARAMGMADDLERGPASGVPFECQAVLYASPAQVHGLRAELSTRHVASRLFGHPGADAFSHVQAILDHLRMLHNVRRRGAWRRTLEFHGVGVTAASRLADTAVAAGSFDAALAAITDASAVDFPREHRRVSKLAMGLRAAARAGTVGAQFDAVLAVTEKAIERRFCDRTRDRLRELDALRRHTTRHTDLSSFLDAFADSAPPLTIAIPGGTMGTAATPRTADTVDDPNGDNVDGGRELLTIAPIAWSRGLQWEAVHVLCSSLNGLRGGGGASGAELRKLVYTAGTRAKQRLVLHHCAPPGQRVEPGSLLEVLELQDHRPGIAASPDLGDKTGNDQTEVRQPLA